MNRRQVVTSMLGVGFVAKANGLPTLGAATSPHALLLDPRNFGARADGMTLDTAALNAAVDACSSKGGGIVYLSPGQYRCGTLILKSNVTLYIEAGAVLLGSKNVADYTPQPGPRLNEDAGQRHLIFARDAQNIGLAGPGEIDGQGSSFWKEIHRKPVSPDKEWSDAIHGDWKANERVSPMIELVNCSNVRIEDLRIRNSAGWTIRPINCSTVYIRGIAINNPVYGPNTDGIDITGCKNVFISDCLIETGDDAICLKSHNPYDDTPRLTQNVVVTNCVITGCCNGFKLGTSSQGGFENITFSNSVMYNNDVDLSSRLIAGIAIEMVDGGYIDGIVITGIQMKRVRAPIFIRRGDRSKPFPSSRSGLRGVIIDGVHASDAILTSSITGLPGMEVEDVSLSNITINSSLSGERSWVKSPVAEVPRNYPQSRMFGWLPASGLYCRHVRGLRLNNLQITAPETEWRPAVQCDDVRDLSIDRFTTTPVLAGASVISLMNVQEGWISSAKAPIGTKQLVSVEGPQTQKIVISGCDLRDADGAAEINAGVPAGSVRLHANIERSPA